MTSVLANCKFTPKYSFKRIIAIILLSFAWYFPAVSFAQQVPERPNPQRLYNDLSTGSDFLDANESRAIEQKLLEFNDSTSNQIAIVIVDDLQGMDANQFATEIGHKWGVGDVKKDNGVVVLISLGKEGGKKKAYIATGYGLESVIPDATAFRVVEEILIPNLKSGNRFEALNATTDRLMALAKGEYNDPIAKKKTKFSNLIPFIIIIVIIIIIANRNRRGGMTIGPRGTNYGGWGWGGGSWGGGSWGGGGSSGGGGGFGGFGGGDFGGGGAGGDW